MKVAMKDKDKDRLSTLRLILAEFKRIEVDERIEVDDARALAVLDKMVKQRRDSAEQYANAGRKELADVENAEIDVIQQFLPSQLSEAELLAPWWMRRLPRAMPKAWLPWALSWGNSNPNCRAGRMSARSANWSNSA